MMYRYRRYTLPQAADDDVRFRWRTGKWADDGPLFRDLSWDFAEPDQYPELVAKQKPGMLAPKGEKAFHAAVASGDPSEILNIAGQNPKYADVAKAIAGLLLLEPELDRGITLVEEAIRAEPDIGKDPFVRKYLPEAGLTVVIAAGVMVHLPLQRNSLVLLVAELHQARGFDDQAIAMLAASEQTSHIRLSQTEVFYEARQFDRVLALTEGVVNDDDVTALMLAYRGRALGELGRDDEAISVLARTLEFSNQAPAIRAIALVGRGIINQTRGEFILAQNDFTQALMEVPDDEEAQQHIQELIDGSDG
jgi:tetratricopeptide (TPR) repeat protein